MAVVLAGPQGWPGQWGRHDNVHDGPGAVRVPAVEAGEREDRPRASAATPQAHRAVAAGVGCREDGRHVSQASARWLGEGVGAGASRWCSSWALVRFSRPAFPLLLWLLGIEPTASGMLTVLQCRAEPQNLTGALGRCSTTKPPVPTFKLCMRVCLHACLCGCAWQVHQTAPASLKPELGRVVSQPPCRMGDGPGASALSPFHFPFCCFHAGLCVIVD